MFKDAATYPNQTIRVAALTRICLPVLHRIDKFTTVEFFKNILGDVKQLLSKRESKVCDRFRWFCT